MAKKPQKNSGVWQPLPLTQKKKKKHEKKHKQYLVAGEYKTLLEIPYSEYLKTSYWQGIRKTMLKIAQFRCQLCNKGGELHVHHRSYKNKGNRNKELQDLIVLCQECHAKFHDK